MLRPPLCDIDDQIAEEAAGRKRQTKQHVLFIPQRARPAPRGTKNHMYDFPDKPGSTAF
jgi:hypothetical protein